MMTANRYEVRDYHGTYGVYDGARQEFRAWGWPAREEVTPIVEKLNETADTTPAMEQTTHELVESV